MNKVNRQYRSYLIMEKDGQITFDGVLKPHENIKVINKKQSEKYRIKNNIQKHIEDNNGSFIHIIYKYTYPLLDKLQEKCNGTKSNTHMIRFIQLATNLNYNNKLYDKNKNRIKKSSLGKIWHVENNRKSINETYKILTECEYIYETEEKYIMINENVITKGAIDNFRKLKKDDIGLTYTRLFTNNIQDMYEGTDAKSRKQLAYLFKILPFINFKHNIFCANPTEKDKTKLEFYTWTDLAVYCGIDSLNVTRFKKDLFKLKIYGYDAIAQFTTGSGYYICINPKIYYSGDCVEDVDFLYKSFGMIEGVKKVNRKRIKKNKPTL